MQRHGFDPWVGRFPGGGHGNTLQQSCLDDSIGVSRVLDKTECLNNRSSISVSILSLLIHFPLYMISQVGLL